jgi:hypothetical protein
MDLFVGVPRILARCFWIQMALKLGFLSEKNVILIFQPLQWWLKFKLADNTSSDLWRNAGHIAIASIIYMLHLLSYMRNMYVCVGWIIDECHFGFLMASRSYNNINIVH